MLKEILRRWGVISTVGLLNKILAGLKIFPVVIAWGNYEWDKNDWGNSFIETAREIHFFSLDSIRRIWFR